MVEIFVIITNEYKLLFNSKSKLKKSIPFKWYKLLLRDGFIGNSYYKDFCFFTPINGEIVVNNDNDLYYSVIDRKLHFEKTNYLLSHRIPKSNIILTKLENEPAN